MGNDKDSCPDKRNKAETTSPNWGWRSELIWQVGLAKGVSWSFFSPFLFLPPGLYWTHLNEKITGIFKWLYIWKEAGNLRNVLRSTLMVKKKRFSPSWLQATFLYPFIINLLFVNFLIDHTSFISEKGFLAPTICKNKLHKEGIIKRKSKWKHLCPPEDLKSNRYEESGIESLPPPFYHMVEAKSK